MIPIQKKAVCFAFARIGAGLLVFALLALNGICPSWFLGLSIAIALLRFSGWLFLQIHGENGMAVPPPSPLSRWNIKVQLAWASALGLHLASGWPPVLPLIDFGYFALACLQLASLYLTFCRFRPHLLEELTLRNATVG